MELQELQDDKVYVWKVFSEILKDLGLPHNRWSILKYEDEGLVKIGRLPRTHTKVISGKEIKNAVDRIKRKAGLN